jgi:hypothetical protein
MVPKFLTSEVAFSRLVLISQRKKGAKQIVQTVPETDSVQDMLEFDKINAAIAFLESRGIHDMKPLIRSGKSVVKSTPVGILDGNDYYGIDYYRH